MKKNIGEDSFSGLLLKLYAETLFEEPAEKKDLITWLQTLNISQKGINKILDQDITMEDFKTMTREDLKCLMLPLGQEIRIWKAIQQETHDSLS